MKNFKWKNYIFISDLGVIFDSLQPAAVLQPAASLQPAAVLQPAPLAADGQAAPLAADDQEDHQEDRNKCSKEDCCMLTVCERYWILHSDFWPGWWV